MEGGVDLIGVPLDLGAGRRGVDMGPSAFRLTGLGARLAALGLGVTDLGDLPEPIPERCAEGDPRQRYVTEIAAVCRSLAERVEASVGARRLPVCLGGDHSLAAGSVAGAARALRNRSGELGLIWVDAHADMNTPETTPSGNVHGMPLAACLGRGPADLVALAGGASVLPDHVALIGIRDLDRGERAAVRASGILTYTMTDIDRRGMAAIMTEVLAALVPATAGLHLSLDLDGLDPEVAPGVGTPVRGGLSYREAHLLAELVAETGHLVSLDLVELNPVLDLRNATGELGAGLVLSALGERIL